MRKSCMSLALLCCLSIVAVTAHADPISLDVGAAGAPPYGDGDSLTGTFDQLKFYSQTSTIQEDSDGNGEVSFGDAFVDSGEMRVLDLITNAVIDTEGLMQFGGYELTARWTNIEGTVTGVSTNPVNGDTRIDVRYDSGMVYLFLDPSLNSIFAPSVGSGGFGFNDGVQVAALRVKDGIGHAFIDFTNGDIQNQGSADLQLEFVEALPGFWKDATGTQDLDPVGSGLTVLLDMNIDQTTRSAGPAGALYTAKSNEDGSILVNLQPCIDITKEVSVDGGQVWFDANDPSLSFDPNNYQTVPGATDGAIYRFIVENCGSTDLSNVTVTDPVLGIQGLNAITIGDLATGAKVVIDRSSYPQYLEQPGVCDVLPEPPQTYKQNIAFVEGYSGSTIVQDSDPAHVKCLCIDIEKLVSTDGKSTDDPDKEWFDADLCEDDDVPTSMNGVEYKFVVSNCGSVPLYDTSVTDPTLFPYVYKYTGTLYPMPDGTIILDKTDIPELFVDAFCANAGPKNPDGSVSVLNAAGVSATALAGHYTVTDADSACVDCPPCTGSIGDFVWHDQNQNGVQDAGEPGIPGVAVTLTGTNVYGATVNMTVSTDADGLYLFSGLCAGDYTVTVATPSGFTPSPAFQGGDPALDSNGSPASVTLSADNTDDLTIDFGFYQPCTGSIGDFVWHDQNQNGVQDAGEPGIPGVAVTLTGTNVYGATVNMTVSTDADGLYLFSGLCAGDYTVTVATPSGFTPSPAFQGGDPALDSNGSPASVTLAADNTDDLTIDFGFYQPMPGIDIEKYVKVCAAVETCDYGHHHHDGDGQDTDHCDYDKDGDCDSGDKDYCDTHAESCKSYDSEHCDYDGDDDCDDSDKDRCDKDRDGDCDYRDKQSCYDSGDKEGHDGSSSGTSCDYGHHDHDGYDKDTEHCDYDRNGRCDSKDKEYCDSHSYDCKRYDYSHCDYDDDGDCDDRDRYSCDKDGDSDCDYRDKQSCYDSGDKSGSMSLFGSSTGYGGDDSSSGSDCAYGYDGHGGEGDQDHCDYNRDGRCDSGDKDYCGSHSDWCKIYEDWHCDYDKDGDCDDHDHDLCDTDHDGDCDYHDKDKCHGGGEEPPPAECTEWLDADEPPGPEVTVSPRIEPTCDYGHHDHDGYGKDTEHCDYDRNGRCDSKDKEYCDSHSYDCKRYDYSHCDYDDDGDCDDRDRYSCDKDGDSDCDYRDKQSCYDSGDASEGISLFNSSSTSTTASGSYSSSSGTSCDYGHHDHSGDDKDTEHCDYDHDGNCDGDDKDYCDSHGEDCRRYDDSHCDYDDDGDCDDKDRYSCDKDGDRDCDYHDKDSCFEHGSGEGAAAVYFRFVVTNTGAVPLSDLTLTDNTYDLAGCAIPATLAPGASFDCEIGPLVAQEGQHVNLGKATGSYAGTSVMDTDPAYYLGVAASTPGDEPCDYGHHDHDGYDKDTEHCDYDRNGRCDSNDKEYCDSHSYDCKSYDYRHCDYDDDGDCDDKDRYSCDKDGDRDCDYHDKQSCFDKGSSYDSDKSSSSSYDGYYHD